jgi:chromosome segregation protein
VEVRAATREREALRERLAALELEVHDARMRCEQLVASIRERYEVEIASFEPAPESLSGTPEERAAELERVRQALRSLGEVHLGAIEEYEEVSERNRYLTEQKADLELSIERLRGAIARINRTSRERFRDTFEAIDKVFQTVFPKMFEGGRAHLSLTESEDVLEAGIEIIAQPPGKKLQNVNLLSGGEKSLTAMALLVAVFTVKPSPFFLLDEVDAALDDANANRFNTLLREMSKTSQFLMITHNKQSIEIADALFGVTMQEPGLSKLVTVDFVDRSA